MSAYSYQSYKVRFGPATTPTVKVLIIINVVVFVLQLLVPQITLFLGLYPPFVFHYFMVWQLVTYMFLHGGLWHILINMLMLWMFGSELEAIWGSRKFLNYYFFTGIGAGLCSLFFYNTPVIGASGAIFALLLAYGMIYPDRILLIFGIFPMKARHAVILFGFIAFLSAVGGARGNIAHFAHLGGLLFGYIYMKNFGDVQSWLNLKIEFGRKPKGRRENYIKEKEIEFSMLDVNRILDKISRDGIKSLTRRERRILEKAKDRIDEL